MAQEKLGGSFAAPLTDELLAEYRATIDSLPADSRARDAMDKLHKCVSQWWELPDSVGTKQRKHQSGTGVVTELQTDHQKALWDAIPWEDELVHMSSEFNKLEQDACDENERRVEAWRESVRRLIHKKYFGKYDREELDLRLDLMRRYDKNAEEHAKALYTMKRTGVTEDDIRTLRSEIEDYRAAYISQCYGPGASTAEIPEPTYLPTKVRDAANHLLWHVSEMSIDREPLTADKL